MKSSLFGWVSQEMQTLKSSFENEWKISGNLREERAELENDVDELENRLENVIRDLVDTEKKLTAQIEQNWKITDAKELLDKQISKVFFFPNNIFELINEFL